MQLTNETPAGASQKRSENLHTMNPTEESTVNFEEVTFSKPEPSRLVVITKQPSVQPLSAKNRYGGRLTSLATSKKIDQKNSARHEAIQAYTNIKGTSTDFSSKTPSARVGVSSRFFDFCKEQKIPVFIDQQRVSTALSTYKSEGGRRNIHS